MSLFNLGRKNNTENAPCACSGGCSAPEEITNDCCPEAKDGICCVKVLGAGCASCRKQYENTKEAVKNLGLGIETEYITDMEKVMRYGVMSMPALVVNDKVVSMGKVLKTSEIENLLLRFGL